MFDEIINEAMKLYYREYGESANQLGRGCSDIREINGIDYVILRNTFEKRIR